MKFTASPSILTMAITAITAITTVIADASGSGAANEAGPDDSREQVDSGFVQLPADPGKWICMGIESAWRFGAGTIRSDSATGGNWLRSLDTFGDFVLKLEWRVSEGGSGGVYIRCAEKGAPWQSGYEVQLSNAARDALHGTGSLYHAVPANPRPSETANVWHSLEIRCHETRIQVIADGLRCIDFDQMSHEEYSMKPLTGFIGLQDANAPPGNFIEYRNIVVKNLDGAPAKTPAVEGDGQ